MFLNYYGTTITCDPNYTNTTHLGHGDDVWTQNNPNEEFLLLNTIYPSDPKDGHRRNIIVRNELEDSYPGYAYRDTAITKFGSASIHITHLPVQNNSGNMDVSVLTAQGAPNPLDIQSTLDPLTAYPFTQECWFNINGTQVLHWTEMFKYPEKVDYNGYYPYWEVVLYDSVGTDPNTRNAVTINFWNSSLANTNFTATGLNIPFNTWHHLALVKHGLRDFSVFLNGVQIISHVQSPGSKPGPFYLKNLHFTGGTWYGGTSWQPYLRGNMDELRFSKVARYNGNFAVPTVPFPDIQCVETVTCDPGWDGTLMLVHFNEPFVGNASSVPVKNELFNGLPNTSFNVGNTSAYQTYPNLVESDATVKRFGASSMRIHCNPEPINPSNVVNFYNSISTVADSAWDISYMMDFTKPDPFTIEYWFRLAAGDQRRSFTVMMSYGYYVPYNGLPPSWWVAVGDRFETNPDTYNRLYFNVWNVSEVLTQWYVDIDTLDQERWYHLAVVKKDAFDFNIFLDGVSVLHKVPTDNWPATMFPKQGLQHGPYIGCGINELGLVANAYLRGWIDELRMTQWARYTHDFPVPTQQFAAYGCECSLNFNDVVFYLHFDGADGGTTFTDLSIFNHSAVSYGTGIYAPATYSTQKKFGVSSARFSGTADNNPSTNGYINLTHYRNGFQWIAYQSLAFRYNDFTVELWIRASAGPTTRAYLLDGRPGGIDGSQFCLYMNSSYEIVYRVGGQDRINGSWISLNTWYHIAVCRLGTRTTLFINGVTRGEWTDTTYYTQEEFRLGASRYDQGGNGIYYGFNGYIDELLILNGRCLYSKQFGPRTSPLAETICATAEFPYDDYMTALAIDYRWLMNSGWPANGTEDSVGSAGTMVLTKTYQNAPYYHSAERTVVLGTADAKSMQCSGGTFPYGTITYSQTFAATAPVLVDGTEPFTMGCWIIVDYPGANSGVFQLFGSNCDGATVPGSYDGMWAYLQWGNSGADGLQIIVQFGDGINATSGNRRSFATAIHTVEWGVPTFVSIVVYPTTNPDAISFTLYVNGVPVSCPYIGGSATALHWGPYAISFGTGFGINNEFQFSGVMDDCFFHFGALSDTQIANLYTRGTGNY